MAIYNVNFPNCEYLGSEILHGDPVDIYYCPTEQPYPTMLAVYGDHAEESGAYSSCDVHTLAERANNPGTPTNRVMIKYLQKLKGGNLVNCEHKNQEPIEWNFPQYIKTQCKDCRATFKYSGLTITDMKRNEPSSVITESFIVKKP